MFDVDNLEGTYLTYVWGFGKYRDSIVSYVYRFFTYLASCIAAHQYNLNSKVLRVLSFVPNYVLCSSLDFFEVLVHESLCKKLISLPIKKRLNRKSYWIQLVSFCLGSKSQPTYILHKHNLFIFTFCKFIIHLIEVSFTLTNHLYRYIYNTKNNNNNDLECFESI